MIPVAEMVRTQGASAKLLVAYRSQFYQSAVLFARRLSFLTASHKQPCHKDICSVHSKFDRCMPVTSSVVKYRLKSDAAVNAVDHFVELGMPQSVSDVQQLTGNITARKLNIDVGDLVRLVVRHSCGSDASNWAICRVAG